MVTMCNSATSFFDLPVELRAMIWQTARKLGFKQRIEQMETKYALSQQRIAMGWQHYLRNEQHLYHGSVHITGPHGLIIALHRCDAYWTFRKTYTYTVYVYKNNQLQYYTSECHSGGWTHHIPSKEERYPGKPYNIDWY